MNSPLFTATCPLIGMIHVAALPGTPQNSLTPEAIIDLAVREAEIYREAGVDGIAIENMHDVPYLNREVGPEITALMAVLGKEVKRASNLPTGIQVLAGANKAALAIALAAGLDFVRAEGFVFSHIADEGMIHADGAELLRYRKMIGADHIRIFTDIKKKHSAHAITADVSIEETARAAEFFLSDGVIITGSSTGLAANPSELAAVKKSVNIPVWVGSGITPENIGTFFPVCDGMIIGSYFKKDGDWKNGVEPQRVQALVEKIHRLRI